MKSRDYDEATTKENHHRNLTGLPAEQAGKMLQVWNTTTWSTKPVKICRTATDISSEKPLITRKGRVTSLMDFAFVWNTLIRGLSWHVTTPFTFSDHWAILYKIGRKTTRTDWVILFQLSMNHWCQQVIIVRTLACWISRLGLGQLSASKVSRSGFGVFDGALSEKWPCVASSGILGVSGNGQC